MGAPTKHQRGQAREVKPSIHEAAMNEANLDAFALAIVSSPRSGNHLVRFLVEYVTGRATLGCRNNDRDPPICRNIFPDEPAILADVDVTHAIAQKAHSWKELSGYEASDGRPFGRIILIIRDPFQAIPGVLSPQGLRALTPERAERRIVKAVEKWFSLVQTTISAGRDLTVIWYDDLISEDADSWRRMVDSLLACLGQDVRSDRAWALRHEGDRLRRMSRSGKGREWNGVRSLGHGPRYHLNKLAPEHRTFARERIETRLVDLLRWLERAAGKPVISRAALPQRLQQYLERSHQ